jgi:hypothetical protein
VTIQPSAVQLSNSVAQVTWTYQVTPTGQWIVQRTVNPPATPVTIASLALSQSVFLDDISTLSPGDTVTYAVADASEPAGLTTLTVADLSVPFTYGPVNPLVDVIRYTTLDLVKQRLNISHNEYDDALTAAIISAEIAIDQWNERSFPDTGTNPQIPGVPAPVQQWALDAAIGVWKAADAPFGSAGTDAWIGAVDVVGVTERIIRRHPLSLGYRIAWGVA